MTVAVALDRVREEVARFGDAAYVITVGGDGRPHVVSVTVAWQGDELALDVGTRTAANAGERPAVSLLWPPIERGGYSLIVDGTARVAANGEQATLAVEPVTAVLHRSRDRAAPGDHGPDCVPVLRPGASG